MTMFYLKRTNVSADRNSEIVFDCVLRDHEPRTANVISQEYELWLTTESSGGAEFLSRLSFDLTPISQTQLHLPRAFKLIWHFTPHQLQRVEDFRQGKEPHFELRSRLVAQVQYKRADGSPDGGLHFVEESASDAETNGYPIRFKLDHVMWAEILNAVDFKHVILHELSIPTFPPGFRRAENHLKDAWNHHRAGREESAMLSCYKAFECLGYSLSGAEPSLTDVVADLMDGQEKAKQEKVRALLDSLNKYCHLGRHDRGPAIHLTHADGELAVVSATALLRYLSG